MNTPNRKEWPIGTVVVMAQGTPCEAMRGEYEVVANQSTKSYVTVQLIGGSDLEQFRVNTAYLNKVITD